MSRWITFLLSLIAQEQCPGFQQPKPLPLSPRLVPIQGDTQEKWFFYDPLA